MLKTREQVMQKEEADEGGRRAQHERYRQHSQAPFGYMLVIVFIIARGG